MRRPIRLLALLAIFSLLAGSSSARASGPAGPVGSLRLIGIQSVPNYLVVDNTLVGGLSGIDFDPTTGTWIAISDDKSDQAPARFYTAELDYNEKAFTSVTIQKATTLLQADGSPYPNAETGGKVPDPESIRFDPESGYIYWTSEGSKKLGLDPFIRSVDADGNQVGTVPLPPMFKMTADESTGPRENLTFEGLTFVPDGSSFWVSLEEPLYQDGPTPTPEAGGVVRFTQFGRDGAVLRQVAYDEDPIQAVPGGDNGDNGVSEILAVDEDHLLVLERSGVQAADGSYKDYIRVYLVDLSGATDVSGMDSLEGANFTPAAKTLVLNLDTANIGYVDNLEGMSWGPMLPDGNPSLVLVADNNFNDSEITQFFAFEVLPTGAASTPVAGATPVEAATPVRVASPIS